MQQLLFDGQQRRGKSGNISIQTPQLNLTDARIGTTHLGQGNAGNITVIANQVKLRDSGVRSEATAGNGGSISARSKNIQIDNSSISVASRQQGTGGNILVNADTIASFNSLISTSSADNLGGQIHINAPGVFIDRTTQAIATSGRGTEFNGQIIINTGNNERLRPNLRTGQIPQAPPLQNRCAGNTDTRSSFTHIANGGNPQDADLLGTNSWQPDLVQMPPPSIPPAQPKYQEAQGWVDIPTPPGATGRWVSFTAALANTIALPSSHAFNQTNCR